MKREKLFASSIVSATASFMSLTLSIFFAFMGIQFLQGGGIIYAIGCIGVLLFAIIAMIMNIVLANKTKEAKAGYSKKGLTIATIVFEVLTLACAVLGPILILAGDIFSSGFEALLSIQGCGLLLPYFLLAIALIASIILKIVALCGKKSAPVAHEERTEEQASV